MEEISVKGENYVKASVLAKKFGYTSDYVGQLCRSGQVKATLLGRSWYVNEESLLRHRKGRYRSSLAKTKESVRKTAEERVQTARPLHARRLIRYIPDEAELLPEIKREFSAKAEKEPRNIVNKPYLSERFDDLSALFGVRPQPSFEAGAVPEKRPAIPPRPRPVVRTIPSLRPIDIKPRAAAAPEPELRLPAPATDPRPAPRRGLGVLFLAIFVIELGLITVSLGLEKKFATIADGTDVVVYNFNPQLVVDSFKSLTVRLLGN